MRAFLGSNHAITVIQPRSDRPRVIAGQEVHTGITVYFKVRSDRLVAALQRHGMAWRKPERVPVGELALSRDFWRGAVDADGSLWVLEQGARGYAGVTLAGHHPMLTAFQQFLARRHIELRLTPTTSGILRISTSGEPARVIIETLYEGATQALPRKLAVARNILSRFR